MKRLLAAIVCAAFLVIGAVPALADQPSKPAHPASTRTHRGGKHVRARHHKGHKHVKAVKRHHHKHK